MYQNDIFAIDALMNNEHINVLIYFNQWKQINGFF